jgi:XTP/dITP diphosphohydrolase
MMEGETNRKARIEHCFAYCEPGKDPIVFSGGSNGIISTEARGEYGRWHDFFYIPEGETRTLAEISDENQADNAKYYGSAIDELAEWLKSKEEK